MFYELSPFEILAIKYLLFGICLVIAWQIIDRWK